VSPQKGRALTDRFPVRFAVALLALCGPAAGLTLEFPGDATETAVRVERMTSYRMPVGPFAEGVIDTRLIEGGLDQRAWRFAAQGRSTLELLQPLRDQVTGAGFVVIFECEAVRCGGFDFRFGTDVLPEPDMHVDLGDFHYLAAERIDQRSTDAGPEFVSLMVVSRMWWKFSGDDLRALDLDLIRRRGQG
jgi:OOP family OmpA-OmpF porin